MLKSTCRQQQLVPDPCPYHPCISRHQPVPVRVHRPLPMGGCPSKVPKTDIPRGAQSAPSPRLRSPSQLTSFCPSPSRHLVKPATGSPLPGFQRSTSCNPLILRGRCMFDGKAFQLKGHLRALEGDFVRYKIEMCALGRYGHHDLRR